MRAVHTKPQKRDGLCKTVSDGLRTPPGNSTAGLHVANSPCIYIVIICHGLKRLNHAGEPLGKADQKTAKMLSRSGRSTRLLRDLPFWGSLSGVPKILLVPKILP